MFFLSLLATETCVIAFMVDNELLVYRSVMLRNGLLLGVIISLVLASLVIFHARWQDILKHLTSLLHSRQSHVEEDESSGDKPEI